MNNNNNNLVKKIFFPGADILYSILSMACFYIFFVFFFICREDIVANKEEPWHITIFIYWYISAILGYISFSLCGIVKKWWSWRFLVIGLIIVLFSFLTLQDKIYSLSCLEIHLPYVLYIIYAGCAVSISIYCMIKYESEFFGRILWILPLFVIGLYLVFENVAVMMMSCIIFLMLLALLDTRHKSKSLKMITAIGIVVFYVVTSVAYSRCNPLLFFKNVKSINILDRTASLVVERNGKYIIVNGCTVTGHSPINMQFDYWKYLKPHGSAFVGFATDKYEKFNSHIKMFPGVIYPIYVTDSCAYFTSQIDTYEILDSYSSSKGDVTKLTAAIFKDFIKLYHKNNIDDYNELKWHQKKLQMELLKLLKVTTDTLSSPGSDNSAIKICKELAENLTIGILNALCSDLIINSDINTALSVFSLQFYLTYYNSPIYSNINVSFNISDIINTDDIKDSITTSDLKKNDIFEYWSDLANASMLKACLYCLDSSLKINEEIIAELERLSENYQLSKKALFDKNYTIAKKKSLEHILKRIGAYESTPMLKRYATEVQRLLYKCVLKDAESNYNSFLINKFKIITLFVPRNSESLSAYEHMSKLDSARFDKYMGEIWNIRNELDTVKRMLMNGLDSIIKYQDRFEHNTHGLSSKTINLLQDAIYRNARRKWRR